MSHNREKVDDLKEILSKLVNLERLSLNSNGFWKLPRDMFLYNTKLKSISLHNNALACLDGVFDDLIDNVYFINCDVLYLMFYSGYS